MKTGLLKSCFIIGALVAPLSGYSADTPTNAPASAKESPKEFVKDSVITTKIKAEFAKDKQISAMRIKVKTAKGVVKLTGKAKSKEEADKAVSVAQDTKGVVSVTNNIQVVSVASSPKKETAKEMVKDSVITTKIKAEFAKDKQVSAMKIKVNTDKGVVKLSGTAKTKEEADQAASIARNTEGVVSVSNDIQVSASGTK